MRGARERTFRARAWLQCAAAAVIGSSDCHGRVAEWQTRWLQVPVSFGTWGFKSPFAHHFVMSRDIVCVRGSVLWTGLNLNVRLHGDIGVKRIGDVTLAMGYDNEVPHSLHSRSRRHDDPRVQHNPSDPHRMIVLRHDAHCVVVVTQHVDTRPPSDG